MNKILGPSEQKIKKTLNKKLRKKQKQQKNLEKKQLMKQLGQNDQVQIYDFNKDFSSSDYESLTEQELKDYYE